MYVAEHYGAFSQLISLRTLKHSEEPAILVGLGLARREPFFTKLKRSGLFDVVISYDEVAHKNHSYSINETRNELDSNYNKLLKENKVKLSDITCCYVVHITSACFATYLRLNKVDFTTVEFMPNAIRKYQERPMKQLKIGYCSKAYHDLALDLQVFGFDKNGVPTKKLLVFPETELKNHEDNEYVEVFDFFNSLDNVPDKCKTKILSCFNIDINFFSKNTVALVLPNSKGATGGSFSRRAKSELRDLLYTSEKYELTYLTICEYFHDKRFPLALHPHPNREISLWDTAVLENLNIGSIDTNMPIEFLKFVPNVKLGQVLHLSTSAAEKLKEITLTEVYLGYSFLAVFHCIDKLWAIMKIINNSIDRDISYYGPAFDTIKALYKYNFDDYESRNITDLNKLNEFSEDKVYIINTTLSHTQPIHKKEKLCRMLKYAKNDCIVFFVNSLYEYSFADLKRKELLDHILPIIIKRSPKKKNPLGDIGEETMYMFCKNPHIREAISRMEFSRSLDLFGIELSVTPISCNRITDEIQKCYHFAVNDAVIERVMRKTDKQKIKIELSVLKDRITGIDKQKVKNELSVLKKRTKEIDELKVEKELLALKNCIIEMKKSNSWKLTKPLRMFSKFLRSVVKNK